MPTRRRRWLWLAVAALALAGLALALDPARQTHWLIQRAHDDLGIALKLSGPARFRFFPSPSLKLEGVRATVPGDDAALLEADSIAIALPWRALWSSAPSVKSLTIDAPKVDLRRVLAWRSARADAETGPPAPPRWPTLETPLHVRGAHWVLTDEWALEDFDLDLDAFGPGARLQLAGRVAAIGADATTDFSFELAAETGGAATLSLDGEVAGSPLAAKLELANTRGDLVTAIARGLQGKVTAPKLRVGDVEIEGLLIEAE